MKNAQGIKIANSFSIKDQKETLQTIDIFSESGYNIIWEVEK